MSERKHCLSSNRRVTFVSLNSSKSLWSFSSLGGRSWPINLTICERCLANDARRVHARKCN